jgi:hypothetical protein
MEGIKSSVEKESEGVSEASDVVLIQKGGKSNGPQSHGKTDSNCMLGKKKFRKGCPGGEVLTIMETGLKINKLILNVLVT